MPMSVADCEFGALVVELQAYELIWIGLVAGIHLPGYLPLCYLHLGAFFELQVVA